MNRGGENKFAERSYAIAAQDDALSGSATSQGIALNRHALFECLGKECAEAWVACGIFEWIALSYLGISAAMIVSFAENVAHPLRLLGMQLFVAAVILALCRIEAAVVRREKFEGNSWRKGGEGEPLRWTERFWHFWRHWYPHLFFLFCFEEMAKLVHLVQPGWQDAKLIAFDHWLTGVNPSLWVGRFARPWLNEFMQFSYFNYFLFLLILGGVLYYRREWKEYWAVMTYSVVGYVAGYVIAMIFPVQSPWFTFAGMWHGTLAGGPFTALIELIEKCGRVHGAAFPSQHVAGATAALWGAWRHRRWLFWVFLPFVLSMDASTVYVRNHYVADVLAGLVTGTLGYVIGRWLMKAAGRGERRKSARQKV